MKEIKITGENVSIEYTIPVIPDGSDNEELRVLFIVHYGGADGTIGRTFSLTFSLV